MSNSNSNNSRSLLGEVRRQIGGQAAAQKPEAGASDDSTESGRRRKSDFWLNVGITIPGGGKDGEDLFISLPNGIALDDMKPQVIRGTNEDWQHLGQAKNALLEMLQTEAATLEPGERCTIPTLSVEIYRRADPAQVADASSNPLVAGMLKVLKGGKQD